MSEPVVVNLKTSEYDIYIGRAGKGQSGLLGNPFPVNEVVDHSKATSIYRQYFESWFPPDLDPKYKTMMMQLIVLPRERGQSLISHMRYARLRCEHDQEFRHIIKNLNGRLGCFCSPLPCHGDNYVELWKEFNDKS